jgi:hypothetical protein
MEKSMRGGATLLVMMVLMVAAVFCLLGPHSHSLIHSHTPAVPDPPFLISRELSSDSVPSKGRTSSFQPLKTSQPQRQNRIKPLPLEKPRKEMPKRFRAKSTSNPLLEGKSRQYIELYYKYFSNATKVEAVPAAIEFLLSQQESGALVSSDFLVEQAKKHKNYHFEKSGGSGVNDELPLCEVTYDAVLDDSDFEYLGKGATASYDYNSCPFIYPSYYVPPVCEKEEEDAKISPMYKWKWVLKAAKLGKCRMPPVTPIEAAAEYLKQKRSKFQGTEKAERPVLPSARFKDAKPGKTVNILWLGLSFMGQQFLSSVCQNYGDVGNGPNLVRGEAHIKDIGDIHTRQHQFNNTITVDPTGRCTPNNRQDLIANLEKTHVQTGKAYKYPSIQCTPHYFEYSKELKGEHITVRYCYSYVFNLAKNYNKYKALPCEFDWSEVDVVFGILSYDEFSKYYIRATGGLKYNLDHVTYVSAQDLINHVPRVMNAAYTAHNFSMLKLPNLRARPKSCLDREVGTFY